MDMKKITTIFWDIGGVILTNGWDEHQRADVVPKFGVDLKTFEPLHHKANFTWERGLTTKDAYLDEVFFYEPQKFTREEIWAAIEGESRVITPGWYALAEKLRVAKYRMATLNNESRELNAYRLTTFELRKYFDFYICSGYVGMMKPERGIYQMALDVAQATPEETVFVDDKLENVQVAASLGMNGIQFTGLDALKADLNKLGIEA